MRMVLGLLILHVVFVNFGCCGNTFIVPGLTSDEEIDRIVEKYKKYNDEFSTRTGNIQSNLKNITNEVNKFSTKPDKSKKYNNLKKNYKIKNRQISDNNGKIKMNNENTFYQITQNNHGQVPIETTQQKNKGINKNSSDVNIPNDLDVNLRKSDNKIIDVRENDSIGNNQQVNNENIDNKIDQLVPKTIKKIPNDTLKNNKDNFNKKKSEWESSKSIFEAKDVIPSKSKALLNNIQITLDGNKIYFENINQSVKKHVTNMKIYITDVNGQMINNVIGNYYKSQIFNGESIGRIKKTFLKDNSFCIKKIGNINKCKIKFVYNGVEKWVKQNGSSVINLSRIK